MSRQRVGQLLRVGDKREVFVTAFEVDKQENAFRFWGQFDNESVERLEDLMQEAQVLAEQTAHPPHGTLSQGDVCLAKFMEDGQWYRARVESVTGNDVIAYFLDFGNTEIIPRAMVRNVEKKLLELPPQATNCKLANVEPILDNSSLKAGTHEFLRKQLEYQTFHAEVIASIAGNMEVKLSDVGSGKDIAFQIIQSSYGRKATGEASPSKRVGYKMMGLEVGSRERVFVSNVNTPNQFWIQQESLTKDLDDLMNDMHMHYSKASGKTKQKNRYSRGDPCVTTFSDDGSFYRAQVMNTIGSDRYEVFYVDYGNSDVKSAEELLDIKSNFLLLPAVAMECCLSDVDPVTCSSDEASARFEELVIEKTICCKVTRKVGDKCSLLMIDPAGGENADIASALVKEGLAARPQVSSPPTKTSPPQGYSSRNVPAALSPAKELDFHSPKFKKPQIRIGDQLEVQLTHVTSGAEFSCHLVSDEEKFQAMMDNLQQTYSSSSPGNHGVKVVAAGLPCCVQFSEDNLWYRAEVTYVRGQDVEVRYVDFGNSETVTGAQLKNLKPQFFNLSVQSVSCTLEGVPYNSAAKSQEVQDFLDSTVAEFDLTAKFLSEQKGVYSVQLTDPSSGDNINAMVKKMLLDASPKVRSPREEMQQDIHTQTLQRGEQLKVFVGHVDQQAKIYVQKSAMIGELETLMENMSTHFLQYGTSVPNISIGMLCGAQYSADEGWYRAKVTGIQKNGAVEVTFVDYGNSEIVDRSKIRHLTQDMLKLPAQAIPCVLQGLPVGQQRSEEVVKLEDYIECECTLEVKSIDKSSGAYVVRMRAEDGKCINDQFKTARPGSDNRQMANDRNVRSPPRSDGYGSRSNDGSHKSVGVKSPPRNDRYDNDRQQRDRQQRGKGGRYNSEVSDGQRLSVPRSDRISVSSNVSDKSNRSDSRSNRSGSRSNRSDDSKGKGQGDRASKSSQNYQAVPLQFTEVTVPAKGKTAVFISHINSPDEFWCQTAESTPQLQRLMSELHARYGSLRPSDKLLKNTTVGTPCVAQFMEDQCWYRGVVVNKHRKVLDILFVDYGNSQEVSLNHVKEIVPELVKLPVLAIKCSLQGNHEWHKAQTEKMKELANRAEPFQCEVKSSDCGVYEVELTWDRKTMTQELRKIKPPAQSAVKTATTQPLSVPPPSKPVSTANAQPSQPAPAIVNIASELSSLQVGTVDDVVVSYWEGPARFWCQLARKGEELDALMNSLDQVEANVRVDSAYVTEGLVCFAKYAEDGAWYRARITNAVPVDHPEVLFIDYGNLSRVPLSDMRILQGTHASLPAQAVQCILNGLTPAQATSSPAIEKFTELIAEKQLVAKVIQKDSAMLTVNLHDTSTAEDIDITEEIKKVVGSLKEPDKYPFPTVNKTTEEVYVTNVDASHGKVYLQASSSTEQLDEITAMLQAEYESCGAEEHSITQPLISQACCTKFSEDGQWYRGVIMAVTSSTATVLFIDYGNNEEKSIVELKSPTDELLKIPQIALECQLDGMPSLPWQQEAVDHFLDITAEKELSCTFKSTQQPFLVQLEKDSVDFNAEMLKFAGTGTRGSGETVPPAQYLPPVISGETAVAYVVNVDAASGKVYLQLQSATEQLHSVTAMLEATYGSCGEDEHVLGQPQIQQACCTKFSEDGQWYRGTVVSVSGATANVFFIDYGNSEDKPISGLKAPTPDLLKIPPIGLECQLDGFGQSAWQQEMADTFIEMTMEKELTCSFRTKARPFAICLKDGEVHINAEVAKMVRTREESEPVTLPEPGTLAGSVTSPYMSMEVGEGPLSGYTVNVDASSGKVYIQLATATDLLDNIAALLEEAYGTESDGVGLEQPSVNQPCCTKFSEDEQWYRGVITKIQASSAHVVFVDYGNSEVKQFSDLRILTPELFEIPQVAIECLLEGVAELPWQQDALDHFLNITAEKELTCTFDTSTKPYLVHVKDGSTDICTEMAKLVGEKSKNTEGDSQIQMTAFKSQVATLKEQKKAEVYITATTTPSDFWVQPLAGEESLAVLMDEIAAYAEDASTQSLTSPAVGAACIAKYSADEGWYRATIIGIEGDSATVQFVDYGNSDSVALAELKAIGPSMMKLEAQAVHCSLYGVSPVDDGSWTGGAAEFLETAVADKLLLMEVIGESGGKLQVKLLDMGISVVDKLIAEGHAVSTAEHVRQFPSVSSELGPESDLANASQEALDQSQTSADSIEQASKDLVEQVLSASLLDLSLEGGNGREEELAEEDMGREIDRRTERVDEATVEDGAALTSPTEIIARKLLDRMLEEVSVIMASSDGLDAQTQAIQEEEQSTEGQNGVTDEESLVVEDEGVEEDRAEDFDAGDVEEQRPQEQEEPESSADGGDGGNVREEEEEGVEEDRAEDFDAGNVEEQSPQEQEEPESSADGGNVREEEEEGVEEDRAEDFDAGNVEEQTPQEQEEPESSADGGDEQNVREEEEEVLEEEEEGVEDAQTEDDLALDGQKEEPESMVQQEMEGSSEMPEDGAEKDEDEEEEEDDGVNDAAEEDIVAASPREETSEPPTPKDVSSSFQEDEMFQSDEECFKDTVATEADQHKTEEEQASEGQNGLTEEENTVATEADQHKSEFPGDGEGAKHEGGVDEEKGEVRSEDAVQNLADDATKIQEQNAEPEADQDTSDVLDETPENRDTAIAARDVPVDMGATETDHVGTDGGKQEMNVAALPEDDITMATEERLGTANPAQEIDGYLEEKDLCEASDKVKLDEACMDEREGKQSGSSHVGDITKSDEAPVYGDVVDPISDKTKEVATSSTQEIPKDVAIGDGDATSTPVCISNELVSSADDEPTNVVRESSEDVEKIECPDRSDNKLEDIPLTSVAKEPDSAQARTSEEIVSTPTGVFENSEADVDGSSEKIREEAADSLPTVMPEEPTGTPEEPISSPTGASEADIDESFTTARGDLSVSSLGGGGDASLLYTSLSTVSNGLGDLDSTLECDKTLDLSHSPGANEASGGNAEEGGAGVSAGGDVVGDMVSTRATVIGDEVFTGMDGQEREGGRIGEGYGEAPCSPPSRNDSGIQEDKDGVGSPESPDDAKSLKAILKDSSAENATSESATDNVRMGKD